MKNIKWIPVLALVYLTGCDNINHTDQNVIWGGLLGAGAGALIGAGMSNHGAGPGALVGACVGILGGLLYDQAKYNPPRDEY